MKNSHSLRHRSSLAFFLVLVLSSVTIGAEFQTVGRRSPLTKLPFAPDEILITFAPGVSPSVAALSLQKWGEPSVRSVQRNTGPPFHKVKLKIGQSLTTALQDYAKEPGVVSVQPNYRYYFQGIPNDPYFSELWGLNNTGQTVLYVTGTPDADIDLPEALDLLPATLPPIVVAVLDTGVDVTHPDLMANLWTNSGEIPNNFQDDDHNGYADDVHGWNFLDNDKNLTDDYGHGTHVAGTLGAVSGNGIGVTGVAPSVQFMALKISDATGDFATTESIVEAIDYAIHQRARVINASWGGYRNGGLDHLLYNAIEEAGRNRIIFVAAAGNDGNDNDANPFDPASYNLANIISVAATDSKDQLADFSNYGTSVHVGAPGVTILSSYPGPLTPVNYSPYAYMNGTSMATPHVVGLVSFLWSAYPSKTHTEIRSYVLGGVERKASLYQKVSSNGRINILQSLQRAGGETPEWPNDVTVNSPTVGPNPFHPNRDNGIAFSHIQPDTQVQIRSISGERVMDAPVAQDGIAFWNGKNDNGEESPSGIYLCIVQSNQGQKILKLVIER